MREETVERLSHSWVAIYALILGVAMFIAAIGALIDSIERRWRIQLIDALRRAERAA
jgi:hypothetical protein